MQRPPLNKFINSRPMLVGSGLLALCVWLVYGQVRHFAFTNFDDPFYIYQNPMVRGGFSPASLWWGLSTSYYDFWHPLTWWSHMLDCELFGLQPGRHHLVNVAFHLANAVLLFGLLARLTDSWRRSLVVALLFALHPMHVESVAWVAERKDVLSTFFLLLSMAAYAGWVRGVEVQGPKSKVQSRKPKVQGPDPEVFYWLSLVAFGLGLMAKAMIVTLPGVLLLLDFWPLGRMSFLPLRHSEGGKGSGRGGVRTGVLIREKWPFFALSLVSALVTFLTMRGGGDLEAAEKVPLSLRLANIPISYVTYLCKLAWPRGLAAFYPLPSAWPAGEVLGSLFVLLVITFLVVRWVNTRPWLCFGWLFFLGTLVPVSGIVANGFQAVADRYTYVPAVGLFIGLVWTVAEAARTRITQAIAMGLAVALIGGCAVLAHLQVAVWQNSGTLWMNCLANTKNNATAECNLGFYYRGLGETNLALGWYQKAFHLQPDNFEINLDLGALLLDSGRPAEATNYYQRALAAMPDSPAVNLDLGVAEMKTGDFPAAVVQLERAVELNPHEVRPLFLRGLAFATLNQTSNAIDCYQRALSLDPDNAQVRFNLDLARNQSALELFQSDRPYRIPPGAMEATPGRLAAPAPAGGIQPVNTVTADGSTGKP